MKHFIVYSAMMLLFMIGKPAHAQVIDLRTGISGNSLIGLTQQDDTWTVCLPGGNPFTTGPYVPLYCGTAVPYGWSGPYTGASTAVRWLSNSILPTGQHAGTPMGYSYYKMTFQYDPSCSVQSAQFNFSHIGGDDVIDQIYVNSSMYPVSYGYNPFSSGTLPISPLDIVPGTNVVILRVFNWGMSPDYSSVSGIQINGNLTIVNGANAAFSLSSLTNSSVTGSSPATGATHLWQVYSSPTGNLGSFNYVATYTGATFQHAGAGPCYLVKHTITTESCGTACTAQSICNKLCDESQNPGTCNGLTPPGNLSYNSARHVFSWNPVPGATSYSVEVVLNDPNCCPGNPYDSKPHTLTIATNSHQVNFLNDFDINYLPACFSWKVIAYCPDGSSVASQSQCAFPYSVIEHGKRDASGSKEDLGQENRNRIDMFPNPAKGMVAIDVVTAAETVLNISICDAHGKVVKTFDNLKTTDSKCTVKWNTQGVSKGIYAVKVTTQDKRVITSKLVVE
jgi:hypothetical protein